MKKRGRRSLPEHLKNCSGIYSIENLVNGKYYIGSSTKVRRRGIQHFSDLRNNRHPNIHLQNAWNKYGEESFVFNILETWNVDTRLDREQKWLDTFNDENCYNMCVLAAAPTLGKSGFSEETIEKMRKRMTENNPMSNPESRRRISESLSTFDPVKSDQICKEFLEGADMDDLTEREGCSLQAIRNAIGSNINKYISGPLTNSENKGKLIDKRVLYNFDRYVEIYEFFKKPDSTYRSTRKRFGLGERRLDTIVGWFRDGNELYNLEPDPNFPHNANTNRVHPESFYLELLEKVENGEGSIAKIGRDAGVKKHWIKTARRLRKKYKPDSLEI